MNSSLKASELYRLLRGKKPATKMLMHVVLALSMVGLWTLVTPVDRTVSFRSTLVAQGGGDGFSGEFQPNCATGGIVGSVDVFESQCVAKGDLLLQFDTRELLIKRNGEVSKIANLETEIDSKKLQGELIQKSFEAKKAELFAQLNVERKLEKKLTCERQIRIHRAQSELVRADKELKRGKRLIQFNAISSSEYSTLRSERQKAYDDLALVELPLEQTRSTEIEAQLNSIKSEHEEELHRLESEVLVLNSKIEALRSEVELLNLRITQCDVVAARDGVVSHCDVAVGDWVPAGPIAVTVSGEGFMAEAFLPSRLIGEVRVGNSAVIVLDGLDWLVHGVIEAQVKEISPDLIMKKTVLGDGSSEEIDGYRVWLELDQSGSFKRWDSLRLGMTGSVEIKTGEEKLALYLLRQAVGESWY